MFRLIVCAGIAGIAAFGGVSWAMRGFPNPARAFETVVTGPADPKPRQGVVTTTFGEDHERKIWDEAMEAARNDRDPKLERVRMEALQTAEAYAMAPCGEFTRLNLIAALTAYTQAWQARVKDCPRLINFPVCGDKKAREVAAAFSTPLDLRVRVALSEAFAKGGIAVDDFPAEVRRDALQFGGSGLQNWTVAACGGRQRSAG